MVIITLVEVTQSGQGENTTPPHRVEKLKKRPHLAGKAASRESAVHPSRASGTARVSGAMSGSAGLAVKCVLVGDTAVGKTALLLRFTSEEFPEAYKPTVYENMGVDVYMDGVPISLGLWDTAGDDTYQNIRPMSYQQADVVLLCFSVANPSSLADVRHKWMAEVRRHLPSVPVVVVGLQTDQREASQLRGGAPCIGVAEGRRVAQELQAKGYLECSALADRGVQKVFECAVRIAVKQTRRQARRQRFHVDPCKVL
ncbi:rho-related GTP-binding protein RhoH [Gadus morhua]|uniref:rho-related GTP-binding protein RhoH n=1 Tax=Gadus morhua TaxID=8049 RepID=UPI0011B7FC6D|nr:rho-related GTP-binding protein RhoH [Gadus morhua]